MRNAPPIIDEEPAQKSKAGARSDIGENGRKHLKTIVAEPEKHWATSAHEDTRMGESVWCDRRQRSFQGRPQARGLAGPLCGPLRAVSDSAQPTTTAAWPLRSGARAVANTMLPTKKNGLSKAYPTSSGYFSAVHAMNRPSGSTLPGNRAGATSPVPRDETISPMAEFPNAPTAPRSYR